MAKHMENTSEVLFHRHHELLKPFSISTLSFFFDLLVYVTFELSYRNRLLLFAYVFISIKEELNIKELNK